MRDPARPPSAPPRLSRWKVALKMLATLAATVLLLEGAIRAVHLARPLQFMHSESYDRFRPRPHAPDWDFRLNSGGFKDVEFGPRRPGAFRIVALGDSFAFGVVPYDSNYLTLLEQGLQVHSPGLEVLNMGIPSTGPEQYLDILVREGLALDPDLVLVSLFVGNDLKEMRRRRKPYTYSSVAMFTRYAYLRLTRYEGSVPHGEGEYCDDCPVFTEEAYLNLENRRSKIYRTDYAEFDALVEEAVACLARIRDLCRERGIDFAVALIPDEMQVDEGLREAVIERFHGDLPRGGWDSERPNRVLAGALAAQGIEFVDLLDDLRRAALAEPVYRPRDTHWNRAGNRVAAEALAEWLRARLPRAEDGVSASP